MNFVSIRIVTEDVKRLVAFYEQATGMRANWLIDDFAELNTPSATLAIASTRAVPAGAVKPAANQSVIIELLVEDVDASYEQLKGFVEEIVQEPTTMPWGNRSLLFRDPDGNLLNFATPVTPEARKRFGL
jgi:predicted enzyme related to lactoylglutathione lyase